MIELFKTLLFGIKQVRIRLVQAISCSHSPFTFHARNYIKTHAISTCITRRNLFEKCTWTAKPSQRWNVGSSEKPVRGAVLALAAEEWIT
jgi:hypothetical protein